MRSVLLGLVLALGSVGVGQAFDLVNATLEGRALCSANLDDIIDIFGRPTAVSSPHPVLAAFIGPKTFFHQLGLQVDFKPATPPVAGQEPVWRTAVYLSRAWDEDNVEWYSQFAGAITPEVGASWRVNQTLAAFEGYDVEDLPPDRVRELYDEAMRSAGMSPSPDSQAFPHRVEVRLDEHKLLFDFEPVTRFLESVALFCSE